MGKPGFPIPLREDQVLPRAREWGNPVFSPYLCVRAKPSRGRGVGKPGFPIPLRAGCALPNPPAGGGMGEPGSPMFTLVAMNS